MDIFGAEYFPPQYTVQSRLNGLEGVARSLDLILRVRHGFFREPNPESESTA